MRRCVPDNWRNHLKKEILLSQSTSYAVCPVRFFPNQNKNLPFHILQSYLLKIIQVENNFLSLLTYLLYLHTSLTNPSNLPTKKEHNHGGADRWSPVAWLLYLWQPLAAISSQWVGWGPHWWILFHYVFWLRKKIILHSSILCYFLSSSELDRPEIVLFALPLRPLPVAHPAPSLLHLTAFFGWLSCVLPHLAAV